MTARTFGGAHLTTEAANRKLGPVGSLPTGYGQDRLFPMKPYVAATTVSITATCPLTCPWMGNGCYEEKGVQRRRQQLLDHAAGAALQVMQSEAQLIDGVLKPEGRPLRLHVGGDVSCTDGAKLLAKAAERWISRGGGPVWGYTHRWREVPGKAWGPVVMFASLEDPSEGRSAVKRGYRPALVLKDFPDGDRAFRACGVKYVPCPFESREGQGITCASCRLCLGSLPKGSGIAFRVH